MLLKKKISEQKLPVHRYYLLPPGHLLTEKTTEYTLLQDKQTSKQEQIYKYILNPGFLFCLFS